MSPGKPNSDVRRRILETADRLFYAEGIRAVGIDRVVAEAGVAKMSLYKYFASKDDLILAVLEHRDTEFHQGFAKSLLRLERVHSDPVRAFFAALREWFESTDFRGCAFMNAALELADSNHPAAEYVRGEKERFADFVSQLVERSVGKRAASLDPGLAASVGLLIEGAIVTAAIRNMPEAADTACHAALILLAKT